MLSDYFYTLKLLLEPFFFVMERPFSMKKFTRFAVGFRQKDQDASRARIFSWSAEGGPGMTTLSLFKNVTIRSGQEGVKGKSEDVTLIEVFFRSRSLG